MTNKSQLSSQNVPWKRYGHPIMDRERKQFKYPWKNIHVNIGNHDRRLHTNDQIKEWMKNYLNIGVKERAFAELWDFYINSESHIIENVILKPPLSDIIKSKRDLEIAEIACQTIIQWLGTNCGQSFIKEAHEIAEIDQLQLLKEADPEQYQKEIKRRDNKKNIQKRLSEAFHATIKRLRQEHEEELDKQEEELAQRHEKQLSSMMQVYSKHLADLESSFEERVKNEIKDMEAKEQHRMKKALEKRQSSHDMGIRKLDV